MDCRVVSESRLEATAKADATCLAAATDEGRMPRTIVSSGTRARKAGT